MRLTGEVNKFQEMNSFAWEASERGQDVHLQALPSQAELLLRQFKEKKEQLKKQTQEQLLAKYGGQEHIGAPKEMLGEQSEAYVEYSRQGKVLKGADKVITRSKYEEDVFLSNHTSVWGSWWESGRWGFACCHALIKNSFCTGRAGIAARESAIKQQVANAHRAAESALAAPANGDAAPAGAAAAAGKAGVTGVKPKKAKDVFEKEAEPELDAAKLEKALQEEDRRRRDKGDGDERKRRYNSMAGTQEVTEEEMEAYRRRKAMIEDPMRNFAGDS